MVEQDRWMMVVGLAVDAAISVGWEERPVEREWVRVTRGEVLVGLGWLIIKQ